MNANDKFEMVVLRRKFKAFLIASLATFSLLAVFWSMSVEGFVSQTVVQLKVSDENQFSQETCQQVVNEVWRQQISDYQLGVQIDELGKNMDITHPVMLGRNFDNVRRALAVEVVPQKNNEQVDLKVRYTGEGSAEETWLVNQIAETLAARFSNASSSVDSNLDPLVEQKRNEIEKSQIDNINRLSWLVDQIESDLGQVRQQTAMLDSVDATEIVELPKINGGSNSPFRIAGHQKTADARISLLKQKLTTLQRQKSEIPSYAPVEDLEMVQSQIDFVERQIAEESNGSGFQKASFSERNTSAVDQIQATLNNIDISNLKSTIVELRETNQLQTQNSSSNGGPSLMGSTLPMFVKGVKPTGLIPLGDMNGQTMMMMLLTALLVGSVVAWGYRPLAEDRGFRDASELESHLKIPVISKLVRPTDRPNEEDVPLCNLVVQLARYTLLAILLVVACTLLFSTTLRELFVADPLTGLSRIMWTLLGK